MTVNLIRANKELADLCLDLQARVEIAEAKLAEARDELDRRAWVRGKGDFSNIEYCGLCHYSREWIAQNGHGENCLLRVAPGPNNDFHLRASVGGFDQAT